MNDVLQFAQPSGGHPDADQLTAFAEHTLPAHEREETLAHLATCAACRRIVFLAQPPEAELLPQPVPGRRPLFAGWGVAWIAAGALAATVALTVAMRHRAVGPATPHPETTARVEAPPVPAAPEPVPAPAPKAPVARTSAPSHGAELPAQPVVLPKIPVRSDGGSQIGTIGLSQTGNADGQQAPQLLPYSPLLHYSAPPPVSATHGALVGAAGGVSGGVGMGIGGAAGKPAPLPAVAPAAVAGVGAPPHAIALSGNAPPPPAAPPVATAPQAPLRQASAATAESSNANGLVLTGRDLDALSDDTSTLSAELLPSHLPAISSMTSGSRTVALDRRGAVFVSKDDGKHWEAVTPRWPGRAVRVSLVGSDTDRSSDLATTAPSARPAPPVAAAQPTAVTAPASAPSVEPDRATVAGRSDLSGSVTDATGAAIPGASIRLRSLAGQEVHTTRAGKSGEFTVVNLEPGGYSLEISAPGFSASLHQLDLRPGDRLNQPVVLQVGQVSTTVEVTSATPAIETQNATLPQGGFQLKKKAAAKPPAFQLTTETGAVWLSNDGKSWKPR